MNKFDNEKIHISIWTMPTPAMTGHADHLPQIEIYTTRGQSAVFNGDDAITFAEWMRDNLVVPILGAK